jgi:hypothetical protein
MSLLLMMISDNQITYIHQISRERESIKEQQNDASGKSNIHTSNRIPTSGQTCFTYLI